jgi:gamma-glutamyltranspeptidase / glutathione hydrolase
MSGKTSMRYASLFLLLLLPPGATRAAQEQPVEATRGMVVSSQHLASEIGVEIMKAGGNAIDAAVAVGYAEAVVNPCCGNIGGGGFMTLHLADGRNRFINFRETAPGLATPDMYLDSAGKVIPGASLYGWKAVAVPGTVLGLDTALREYGTLPRAEVMGPAIRLARQGFVLVQGDTDLIEIVAPQLRTRPDLAQIFLRPDGNALQPGDRLVQPELADTLEAISKNGSDAFYKGRIPQAVETASDAAGGILKAADFANYTISESEPLKCNYRGYRVFSAPPPSSGGTTLCEIVTILSGYNMKALGFHSAAAVHAITEAERHAYLDRNTYLGDPNFVTNPVARLLSPQNAAAIRAVIPAQRAGASNELRPSTSSQEKTQTTHYSILDKAGNAVSVTYTINGGFGAFVMAPGTGFLLNDEMDDFTAKLGVPNKFGLVQGAANAIAPGKRPLSSMAPTVVTKNGRVFLVLGSPGGSRIITIVLETLLDILDYDLSPTAAVSAPRFHHQWLPDAIDTEPLALSADTLKTLKAMGYEIRPARRWGAMELILAKPHKLYGVNDDRSPAGAAVGY